MNIFRYTIYTRVKCLQLVHSMQTTREAKHCFHIADAGAWEAMEIASLGCHGEPSVEGAQFLAFAGKRHQNLPELRAKPWSATTLVQKGIVRNMTEITPVREISFYVAALNREQAEVWAAGKTQLFVCACFPPHSQLHPHVFNPEDTGSVQPQTLFPLARVAWDARRKHGDKTQVGLAAHRETFGKGEKNKISLRERRWPEQKCHKAGRGLTALAFCRRDLALHTGLTIKLERTAGRMYSRSRAASPSRPAVPARSPAPRNCKRAAPPAPHGPTRWIPTALSPPEGCPAAATGPRLPLPELTLPGAGIARAQGSGGAAVGCKQVPGATSVPFSTSPFSSERERPAQISEPALSKSAGTDITRYGL